MSEQADPGHSSAVRRGTTIVLPPIIKAVMKRDWHGQEHIPREGGVIIAPNHLSYADWAAVAGDVLLAVPVAFHHCLDDRRQDDRGAAAHSR